MKYLGNLHPNPSPLDLQEKVGSLAVGIEDLCVRALDVQEGLEKALLARFLAACPGCDVSMLARTSLEVPAEVASLQRDALNLRN